MGLTSMCYRKTCYTSNGYLRDSATDMCLTVNDVTNNGPISYGQCSGAEQWNMTDNGFNLKNTGYCWHPLGGSNNPDEDTQIVVYNGDCNEDRASFEIEEEVCWEEVSNSKMGKKLKDADNKVIKTKNFNKAKDWCVQNDDCNGLFFNGVKYLLSGAKKVKSSNKATHKAFIQVSCDEACDAGTMLCDDGECRQSCTDEDEGCPSGTTLCDDGTCKHEHMC